MKRKKSQTQVVHRAKRGSWTLVFFQQTLLPTSHRDFSVDVKNPVLHFFRRAPVYPNKPPDFLSAQSSQAYFYSAIGGWMLEIQAERRRFLPTRSLILPNHPALIFRYTALLFAAAILNFVHRGLRFPQKK